jgi:hypothetical protein
MDFFLTHNLKSLPSKNMIFNQKSHFKINFKKFGFKKCFHTSEYEWRGERLNLDNSKRNWTNKGAHSFTPLQTTIEIIYLKLQLI